MDILRKRELKWLDMLENWEKWMSKRFKKVSFFSLFLSFFLNNFFFSHFGSNALFPIHHQSRFLTAVNYFFSAIAAASKTLKDKSTSDIDTSVEVSCLSAIIHPMLCNVTG